MGGETERNISGWTTDTLKEYFDARLIEAEKRLEGADTAADVRNEQRFTAQQQAVKDALTSQEKAVSAALVAAEKAVLVAETNAEKWRMNAHEWRASMLDREQRFASRIEMEAKFEGFSKEIAGLKESRAEGSGEKGGRLSQQQLLMMIVSIIVALIVIGGAVVGIAFAIKQ